MIKMVHIAWKDLIVRFRDPSALVLLLITPFALTLAIAFAFGGLGGGRSSAGLADIPVVIVNHDAGELGPALVEVFESDELAELVEPINLEDEAAARAMVDADEAAAVVIIPPDLTDSVIPPGLAQGDLAGVAGRAQAVVDVYVNPARPISAGVVRGIVDVFLGRVAAGAAGAEVAVTQLVMNQIVPMQEVMGIAEEASARAAERASSTDLITIVGETGGERQAQGFDWLTYMAPSMAILFLMFTVTAGGRSILAERDEGTLPRMLTTPTTAAQVLGGKIVSIILTGLAQLAILIAASGLIFGVNWGDPAGLVLVTTALVAAATGWGTLIAAVARTPAQANGVGTALALVFAAAAGNFVPRPALPTWLQAASYVSPNAWGLEAYASLVAGERVADMTVPILALLGMAVILFAVSIIAFRRQYA